MDEFMKIAIDEAYEGIRKGDGGPFGAVIVKDGKIVCKGHNCVVSKKDPTNHGEIMAIHDACKNLDTFDLSGCTLYTTSAPCPMCSAAIMWANIEKVYYGCTIKDAESIGFRDSDFFAVLKGEKEGIETLETGRKECLELFKEYDNMDKTMY